ncbi:MAG: GNAT family N-acetyltransferase [Bryobacteraceae bacterium]
MDVIIRAAALHDIPALELLIPESVRGLQKQHYSSAQMDGALGTVFGVDRKLIEDGTYLVAEVAPLLVGCGGWSKRKTLFGSAAVPGRDDALLDPSRDAARIRAFFVHPDWARQGIGARILRACEEAAAAQGFLRFELGATLSGEPLYRVHGYRATEHFECSLPNGLTLPLIRMAKP